MIKYRIKEFTYGNGSMEFEAQKTMSNEEKIFLFSDNEYEWWFLILFIIISCGILFLIICIIPRYKQIKTFDDLYEAQLYVEQEQERDKQTIEQEQKAKELKKAQKIVSERVIKCS